MAAPMKPSDPYLRRWTALDNECSGGGFMGLWRDINSFLLPRRGRFLSSDTNKALLQNQKIIDSEATWALNVLVSGLLSGVTNPARRWFRLTPTDPALRENSAVKAWTHRVENLLYEIFSESNLYQVLPSVYEDMGCYGTAAMIHLDDFDDVARFQSFPIGEYRIAQDHKYKVNSIYRKFKMTVEQIVRAYGLKRASKVVKHAWKEKQFDKWIEVLHVIEPNDLHDETSPFAKDKKFRSVVLEVAGDGDLLHEGGFDNFRVYAPRWHLQNPDVYGRGPGEEALGDIKQLMSQQKKKGEAIAKMVKPSMVAGSGMKNTRMSLLPGDVTFSDTPKASDGFAPAYMVQPRLAEFLQDMQEVKERIRRAFHADKFMMFAEMEGVQPRNDLEVNVREQEKLLVLGPVLERLNHDLLRPLIDNTFQQCVDAGLIPDAPPELEGKPLKIEYMSVMADAQRSQGIAGLMDTAAFVANLAQLDEAVLDKFDMDQAIDEFTTMRGTPPSVIRGDDVVEGRRKGRAQQEQAMQQAAMTEQAATAAKTLSETSTDSGNLLNELMGGGVR